MGMIFSFEDSRCPMEAAAMPLPSPESTPPVTIINFVGIILSVFSRMYNDKSSGKVRCEYAASGVFETDI
jgi:hypothetical protein